MRCLLDGRLLAALAAVLYLASFSIRAETPFSFHGTPGQLPKSIVPRHYTLRLQPDTESRSTAGTARIDFEALQPVREIVLNALELDIASVELRRGGSGDATERITPNLDSTKQTLTLPLGRELPAGNHALTIVFRGKIGVQAQGFFVDKYPTSSGDKYMLGTQMEPTDARRVFPCWDEPVYRATYDVTLVVRDHLMAVANTPVLREGPAAGAAGWKEVAFTRTPAMPSYLVAFYAGEFETVEGEQDGVKLRIITTQGKRASALFALESTRRILAWYHEYFGVPYPLPKLDQIAVPNAFSNFSAMENWGLISYIDTAILYDPQSSSQERREAAFKTIAHEIAHQWFGNLVTMAWWDNLWLNEGFASWIATKSSAVLNPEWQLWLRANTAKERAMELDARRTTHPIQQPIANESQATDAFDVISYQKGQSFLRMLESYLGEETFRAGIRRYITRHKYSNTTTADLWAALGEASGKPVVALAAAWTEQPGFPVLLVSSRGAGAGRQLEFEQARFALNDPSAAPLTWQIPITYGNTANLAAPAVILLEGRKATAPWPAGAGTVKVNVGEPGYYRVLYDEPLGTALAAELLGLPPADQLNLLSDTWALVEAGRVPASSWLSLVEKLRGTKTAPILSQIVERLLAIDNLQLAQPGRRTYQAWVVELLGPQLARIGWEAKPGESPLDNTVRAELIQLLGACGDRGVIAECTRRFAVFRQDATTLPGDLRGPVLYVVGRYATRETYDQLHALARQALTTEEKRRAYAGMQAALDPALARETLELSLAGEMSINESTKNVGRIAAAEHPALAWDFARRHLDALLGQMTFFGRNGYLPNIMKPFTEVSRAEELEAYTREKFPPDAVAESAKISDRIRHLAIVKQRELPVIDAWVKERVKNPEP